MDLKMGDDDFMDIIYVSYIFIIYFVGIDMENILTREICNTKSSDLI